MQSLPSYVQDASFLPPPQPFEVSPPYPYPTKSSCHTTEQAFEQALPTTTESYGSPVYPLLHRADDPEDKYSMGATFQSLRVSHRTSYCSPSTSPYPSPSPEPSRQTSQWCNMPAHTAHPPNAARIRAVSPETTMACISPDLIYPSARYDLEVDHRTDASSQSSRASHRNSSFSPYPYPSPEPYPQTSSIVIASRSRNAPARTAAPVPAKTWQCPHCPYVQRNHRSPDLKRHIKTHTRSADVVDLVCCRVFVLNVIELGVLAATVCGMQMLEFDGVLIIGGCRKAFSRREALKRHLQREKGKCFGDASSLH